MKTNITRTELTAIQGVLTNWIDSICVCDKPGEHKGFRGHDLGCWVHINRKRIATVEGFIEQARKPAGKEGR